MPYKKLTITPEFEKAVDRYRQEHNIKSWAEACLMLAARGLSAETGKEPPRTGNQWGGVRVIEKVNSDNP